MSLHGVSKGAWGRKNDSNFRHYDVVSAGYKYNMMDLQAALGISQLLDVMKNWSRRRMIWNKYISLLAGLPLIFPSDAPAGSRHGHHLFAVQVRDDAVDAGISRDFLIERLTSLGIGVGVHYHALTEFSYFRRNFGWNPDDTPVATKIGRRTLSLPLNQYLSDQDVDRIVLAVRQCFENA